MMGGGTEEILELAHLACLLWGAKQCYDEEYIATGGKRKRRHWVSPSLRTRDKDGLFATSFEYVYQKDPEQFKANVRMSPEVFDILIEILKKKLTKKSYRPSITPKFRLFLTLTYLAHGESTRELADMFKLGMSTVRGIIKETCEFLWDVLAPTYVATPNPEQLKSIAYDFDYIYQLPHCVGAIGGKCIPISCPPRGKEGGAVTTVFLGICDASYTFTQVHLVDSTVLCDSNFGKNFIDQLHFPKQDLLTDSDKMFPYFLAGSSAFPLRHNLMRPYPEMKADFHSEIFNQRLERATQTIENAFGVLTARWKVLLSPFNVMPSTVHSVVKATIALHNFIKVHDDSYCPPEFTDSYDENGQVLPGLWRSETKSLNGVKRVSSNNATKEAFELRNILQNYLIEYS